MAIKDDVLKAMKDNGKPMSAGDVVKALALTRRKLIRLSRNSKRKVR